MSTLEQSLDKNNHIKKLDPFPPILVWWIYDGTTLPCRQEKEEKNLEM